MHAAGPHSGLQGAFLAITHAHYVGGSWASSLSIPQVFLSPSLSSTVLSLDLHMLVMSSLPLDRSQIGHGDPGMQPWCTHTFHKTRLGSLAPKLVPAMAAALSTAAPA